MASTEANNDRGKRAQSATMSAVSSEPYDKNRYKKDAVLICILWNNVTDIPTQLSGILTSSDYREAQAVVKSLETAEIERYRAAAVKDIQAFPLSALTAATMTEFLYRFRNGPVEPQPESPQGFCKMCRSESNIYSLLNGVDVPYGAFPSIDLGTVKELKRSAKRCKFCYFLYTVLRTDPRLPEKQTEPGIYLSLNYRFYYVERRRTIPDIEFSLDKEPGKRSGRVPIAHLRPVTTPISLQGVKNRILRPARLVGPKFNPKQLITWLRLCQNSENHRSCRPLEWPESTRPQLRFIDVKQRCICEPSAMPMYLVLSYVWGKDNFLRLTNNNKERLMTPGRLSSENEDIPRTIKDAMDLTVELGFTFLWIDALCIIQDNKGDQEVQIAVMDRIYSCAQLAIVNDMPGANEGIPGVGPSRRLKPTLYNCKNQEWTNVRLEINEALAKSPWESRGWTFQEKICSKRLLIMTQSQAFYHCQHATWFEDVIIEDTEEEWTQFEPFKAEYNIHNESGNFDLKFLSQRYQRLVEEYCKRKLTYEHDVLNAFTGVLNSFGCGHTWGLLDPVFHDALCWKYDFHDPKDRRPDFPSWSWAGWKIRSDFKYRPGFVMENSPEFRPVCFKIQQRPTDQNTMEHIQIHSDVEGRWNYDHLPPQATRGLQMGPFRYCKEGTAPMPPVSHILRFWTMVFHLTVKRTPYVPTDPLLPRKENEFEVINKSGRYLGMVYVDPEWRRSQPDALEFIAICSRVPLSAIPSRMLLIERDKNDIAYRVQLLDAMPSHFSLGGEEPEWKIVALG